MNQKKCVFFECAVLVLLPVCYESCVSCRINSKNLRIYIENFLGSCVKKFQSGLALRANFMDWYIWYGIVRTIRMFLLRESGTKLNMNMKHLSV